METEVMKVAGMTGDDCICKVTHALEGLSGVYQVHVSLGAGVVTVHYDESITASNRLQAAVAGAGYGVEATMPLTVLDTGAEK